MMKGPIHIPASATPSSSLESSWISSHADLRENERHSSDIHERPSSLIEIAPPRKTKRHQDNQIRAPQSKRENPRITVGQGEARHVYSYQHHPVGARYPTHI